MAHPPRSKPPLRSSLGPPISCITPSTETLVVVVNLMSCSPPHVHAWCAHEARIASRRRGVLSETDVRNDLRICFRGFFGERPNSIVRLVSATGYHLLEDCPGKRFPDPWHPGHGWPRES